MLLVELFLKLIATIIMAFPRLSLLGLMVIGYHQAPLGYVQRALAQSFQPLLSTIQQVLA